MALMNLTKEIEKINQSIKQLEEWLASKEEFAGNRSRCQNYEDLVKCRTIAINYQNYIAKVLDAIIELYKREDKKVVGVPYKKDYKLSRKALDSLVFSKEGNIVHLQIREDMDKSSYRIIILENDQLKAERL